MGNGVKGDPAVIDVFVENLAGKNAECLRERPMTAG